MLTGFTLPFSRAWNQLFPGARILMYHRITDLPEYDQLTVGVDNFRRQMTWLSKNRQVCTLTELVGNISKRSLKANQVAITFDDGYLDNLEYALPILEEFGLPATVYITSDFAAQKLSHPRYKRQYKRLHLNWQEIQLLSEHPLITIGSHTVSHPMLSELSYDDSLQEISVSKERIASTVGHECNHFCYPSGNFGIRERSNIVACGFQSAVTVKPGRNTNRSDLFTLCRTEITDRDDTQMFAKKLDGAFDVFHFFLDIKREILFYRNRKIKFQEYSPGGN